MAPNLVGAAAALHIADVPVKTILSKNAWVTRNLFKVVQPETLIPRYVLIIPLHGWTTLNRFFLGVRNKWLQIFNSQSVIASTDKTLQEN